jgi:hypothetical protein
MNTMNTISISSYRNQKPAFRRELSSIINEEISAPKAAFVRITDKKDTQSTNQGVEAERQFIMPPLVRAYLKGRDNDPL